MELSELTAYAKRKFHIQEEYKWADFPYASVLTDPHTGKWVALLMRQWDTDTGTEIQRCDIKCGWLSRDESEKSYLTQPFRMKGEKWVGVIMEAYTEPNVIFRLFDRAVYGEESQGFTITLETAPRRETIVCPDPAMPDVGEQMSLTSPDMPEKILKMRRMFQYENGILLTKNEKFYRQGRFMEDYEDDAPWTGSFRCYFPTYQDLNLRMLRGYFTWRTHVRRGEFRPIALSLAYIYIYELLNGIGVHSPEESLRKMREFEQGFLDTGLGNENMRQNLHRWMLEYAVLQNLPPELAREYADPGMLEMDRSIEALRFPQKATDEEIVSALHFFSKDNLNASPIFLHDEARGVRLLAAVWRYMAEHYRSGKKDFFTVCFDGARSFRWHPLANAVYWEKQSHPDAEYALDECRIYRCTQGIWFEKRFDKLFFDRERFQAFLHESERGLREYLKAGYKLRKRPKEDWVTPYVEAVLEEDRRREEEAARPKIQIDFSRLPGIRQEARKTRNSLLTEEEVGEMSAEAVESGEMPEDGQSAGLDALYSRILRDLLAGKPVEQLIKSRHLMPSVITDTVNEALIDEIGDSVLEWDGHTLSVVEEYREEVLQLLGG